MKRKYIYLLLVIIFLPINSNCQWEVISQVSGVLGIEKIFFVNSTTGFSGGYPGKIFRTTDGGANWDLVYQQNIAGIYDIEFINESTGFVIYNQTNLLKTTNSGINWVLKNFGNNIITSIYFLNENVGFLTPGANYSLYKTTNSGVNWFELNSNLAFTSLNDIKFFNNDTGLACGRSESFDRAYIGKTTNGGINWSGPINSPGYESPIYHLQVLKQDL